MPLWYTCTLRRGSQNPTIFKRKKKKHQNEFSRNNIQVKLAGPWTVKPLVVYKQATKTKRTWVSSGQHTWWGSEAVASSFRQNIKAGKSFWMSSTWHQNITHALRKCSLPQITPSLAVETQGDPYMQSLPEITSNFLQESENCAHQSLSQCVCSTSSFSNFLAFLPAFHGGCARNFFLIKKTS